MAAFAFTANKAQPSGFDSWTHIPGGDERAALRIQNDLKADTVLIIDANKSMAEFWSSMAADSAQLAYALMEKDLDGIDIFFAGVNSGEAEDDDSPAGGFLNVSNPLFLLEAFQKIKEAGFSDEEAIPTVLSSVVNKYLDNYTASSLEERVQIKELNVIVWTDGSYPQGPFEDTLVEIANALKKADAPETQVGIQLFQAGSIPEVKEKFMYYDDQLKTTHGLDRDLVDYTEYEPNSFTVESLTKIAAGAVDKSLD